MKLPAFLRNLFRSTPAEPTPVPVEIPAEPAPAPVEEKPIHVSKSLCKKALQHLFGPTAYLQTLREGSAVVGMRAVAKSRGELVEIARITVKPGMALEPEHVEELPFHMVREAGKCAHADVRRGRDKRGNPEIQIRKVAPAITVVLPDGPADSREIRLADADADLLSTELEKRGTNLATPCGKCRGCGPDSQPCLLWGHWAVKSLGLTPDASKSEPVPPLKSDADVTVTKS